MKTKYINPFTDFGFKKLFGEETSKPILIHFLNQLLSLPSPLIDLNFRNPEQLGFTSYDRKAIYDLYCTDELGRHFIVMPKFQKAETDLASYLEKWLYCLKHLEELESIPASLDDPIFEQVFERA